MNPIIIRITTIIRMAAIAVIVVLAAVFSIPSMIINPSGYISFFVLKTAAKSILKASGVKTICEGLENIDRNKIMVFAVNHTSNYDIPVLYSVLPVQVGWLAKKELFRIPFLGWLMKANKFISIDRGEGRKAIISLHAAVEKIKKGTRIIIFPEGTRSLDGRLLPFKKLLFRLCLKTGVPIVPIYISGAIDIMKADSLLIRPGKVKVTIGREIDTTKYAPNKVLDLMEDLRNSLIALNKEIK